MISIYPRKQKRATRAARIRTRLAGSAECPRVAVFRSGKHIAAQAIDDTAMKTIAAASDYGAAKSSAYGAAKSSVSDRQVASSADSNAKTAQAEQVGQALAASLKAAGVSSVVFDRAGYAYHGRVKALAEALRTAKLLN